ncbi:hypothetical protein NDA13_006368 [Ustilago tritici]|nr:hypothetical protein NDA13_006368 [Ustilago tritici]
MYSTQGNRKVLPNYLLDDYVPSSNPKPPINNGTRSSSLHVASEALQRHHHPGVGPSNSSADGGGGERGDASSIGLLPRRKKKLRQACIYCRRSHLVCEDKRPCHRCVKRGIADRCVDPPQDGQPLQDGGWFAGQETGSNAGSIKDAFVSPMPPAAGPGTARPGSGASSSTLMGMDMTRLDSGQRCKRKAKTEVPHQHINDVERHGDNRPSGAYEFSNPASLYTSTPTHAHAIPTSTATGQGSLLSSAMPHHSAAPFSAMPVPVPLQAEFSTAARAANSQLLQGPLFHPQHAEQQRSIPSTHPQHHPSNQIAAGSLMHASHGHHTDPSAGSCMDQHNPRRYNGAPTHSQQMRPHPAGTSDASNVDLSSIGGTNAVHANVTNTGAIQPAPVNDRRRGNSNPGHQDRDTSKAVAPVTGQNPGDVSVEAALSKVRRLWFSLEDNIQPSSMIQLQAEWAGNVRYFSESVVPFTPVPMVVCRKAGEVYASNQLAQDLCGRRREQLSGGKMSCYELMTESSASEFFRLYETAVGGMQAEDGSYVPTVGNTAPLYWNAEIVRQNDDGSKCTVPTRGVFEMKIAPCGLPSLLVVCFVPLS